MIPFTFKKISEKHQRSDGCQKYKAHSRPRIDGRTYKGSMVMVVVVTGGGD